MSIPEKDPVFEELFNEYADYVEVMACTNPETADPEMFKGFESWRLEILAKIDASPYTLEQIWPHAEGTTVTEDDSVLKQSSEEIN